MKTFFLFLLFPIATFAAAPFTHLVLAKKFLENSFPVDKIQKRDFFVGNLFPDIQHLGEISRGKTHEKGLSLEDIHRTSSYFAAGMRLHAFVDEVRENFALNYGIYDELEKWGPNYRASLLKCIEDEILCDLAEPGYFSPFFEEILNEELAWGCSLPCTETWHRFCRDYLNQRPRDFLLLLATEELPYFRVPPPLVQLWSEEVPRLAAQGVFRTYVRDLFEHFSALFEKRLQL